MPPNKAVLQTDEFNVSVTLTRPSDTTAYAAGDVISDSTSAPTILTFSDISNANRPVGQQVVINTLLINVSTAEATVPQLKLHLFNSAPTAVDDNDAFALSDADALKRVISIQPIEGSTATNNYFLFSSGLNYTVKTTSLDLSGILEVLNVYTPTSAEIYTLTLLGYRL